MLDAYLTSDVEPERYAGHDPYAWSTQAKLWHRCLNYHTGETVVLVRHKKRRKEIAELLEALHDKHPNESVYVGWDNASTHEDDEIEAVVRGTAG